MATRSKELPRKILIVEDNLADADLMREALEEFCLPNDVFLARDGMEALDFLRHQGAFGDVPSPDLVLLDLNLPKKDGREVLADIKSDDSLKAIPVIIVTTSQAEEDIARSYSHHANCYLQKPSDLDGLFSMVRKIQEFWCQEVKLPRRN